MRVDFYAIKEMSGLSVQTSNMQCWKDYRLFYINPYLFMPPCNIQYLYIIYQWCRSRDHFFQVLVSDIEVSTTSLLFIWVYNVMCVSFWTHRCVSLRSLGYSNCVNLNQAALRAVLKPENISNSQAKQIPVRFVCVCVRFKYASFYRRF